MNDYPQSLSDIDRRRRDLRYALEEATPRKCTKLHADKRLMQPPKKKIDWVWVTEDQLTKEQNGGFMPLPDNDHEAARFLIRFILDFLLGKRGYKIAIEVNDNDEFVPAALAYTDDELPSPVEIDYENTEVSFRSGNEQFMTGALQLAIENIADREARSVKDRPKRAGP